MKKWIIWNVATVAVVIAAGGLSGAKAAQVGIMPIPIKVTLEATIRQCVAPRIPESDCLRFCFPSLGKDKCLEVVKPWPRGEKQ